MVNGPPGTGKSFTIAAIAADRLSQGESVLIAAKNPQAVEVIADKLERDFELPRIAIRATRKDYRKHLRRRLKDWLNGLGVNYVYPSDQRRIKIELDTYLSQTATVAQYLFLSVNIDQLPADHLLTRYLRATATIGAPTLVPSKSSFAPDAFLTEVSQFITQQGVVTLLENYPIAGLEIDLVVVHQDRTYCIDLIGFPGSYQMALPLERWRMLERLGIPCFALPYSQWINREEESKKALKTFLQLPH